MAGRDSGKGGKRAGNHIDSLTTAPALSFIGTGINDASANSYSTLFETHGRGSTGGTGDVSASAPLVAGQTAQAAVTTGTVGQLPPLSLFASGTTMPSAPGSFGQFDAQAASRDWVFTLAPQTQVTFYATSNLNVALTGGGARHRLHHPGDRKHSAGAAQPGNGVGGVRQPDGQCGHRVSVCHGLCLWPLAGRASARAGGLGNVAGGAGGGGHLQAAHGARR